MKQGDDFASSGNWRAAVEEYRAAREAKPKSEEAANKLKKARRKAMAASLRRGKRDLAEERFEDAVAECEYVQRLDADNAEAGRLIARVRERLVAKLQAAIRDENASLAYECHGKYGKLFPEQTAHRPSKIEIRKVVYRRADGLADEGDYEGALASLEVISEHESKRVVGVAKRRESYRNRWANSLESEARSVERRDHYGAAAVLWSKAYRVSGRRNNLKEFRRCVAKIEHDGRVALHVDYAGRGSRDLRANLTPLLDRVQGVRLEGRDQAVVDMTAHVESPRCRQSVVNTTTESKRYLAGTKTVDNPEWDRVRDDLHDCEHRVRHMKNELEAARRIWRKRKRATRRCDEGRLRSERHRLRRIEKSIRRHARGVKELERERRQKRRRLRQLENDENCPGHKIEEARAEVERLNHRIARERRKHREARKEMRIKEEKVEAMVEKHRRIKRRAEKARQHYHRIARRYEDAVQERESLERELRRTPRTKTEKVWGTFRYEVATWKRSCSRRISVEITMRDGERIHYQLTRGASTTDKAHDGFGRYGVARDRKSYPKSRGELVARLDNELGADFKSKAGSAIARVVRQRVDRALEMSGDEPHGTTDRLLSIAITAGTHLDGERRNAIASHINEHYDAHLAAVTALVE